MLNIWHNKVHTVIWWPATWWRHQMETFSALLVIRAGNSTVTGEFPATRPLTRRFDVFFDLLQNKRSSKHWWGSWLEAPSRPLWRHCHGRLLSHTVLWPRCIAPVYWWGNHTLPERNQLWYLAALKWPTLRLRSRDLSTCMNLSYLYPDGIVCSVVMQNEYQPNGETPAPLCLPTGTSFSYMINNTAVQMT